VIGGGDYSALNQQLQHCNCLLQNLQYSTSTDYFRSCQLSQAPSRLALLKGFGLLLSHLVAFDFQATRLTVLVTACTILLHAIRRPTPTQKGDGWIRTVVGLATRQNRMDIHHSFHTHMRLVWNILVRPVWSLHRGSGLRALGLARLFGGCDVLYRVLRTPSDFSWDLMCAFLPSLP
jgi:hypothetical protein